MNSKSSRIMCSMSATAANVPGLLHCAGPLPVVISGGVAVPVERKPEISAVALARDQEKWTSGFPSDHAPT
jgi:hypothetical protein